MRTYSEARTYSKLNPSELVELKECYYIKGDWLTGFFLNGKQEGVFEYFNMYLLKYRDVYNSKIGQTEISCFRSNGDIRKHYFSKNNVMYGEYIEFNEDGTVNDHCFYNSDTHIKELDDLLDAERDEAFYFTLAMYGIDKEYTCQ